MPYTPKEKKMKKTGTTVVVHSTRRLSETNKALKKEIGLRRN
jgi:uncharacterized protein YqjF (DUF2071 family)